MTTAQLIQNLDVPQAPVDVILDTDAFNEIDDQYAIAYLLNSGEKLHIRGFCAAPFYNHHSTSPADGMERSFAEIQKLLKLAGREALCKLVFPGSREYLPDENTPVESEAARFLADCAGSYSPEQPLYIVSIGAITNVASALLMNPQMKEKTVVIWLGGDAHHCRDNREFNLFQDVAAARVVFGCGVPLVQLPCCGVVDHFLTTEYELRHWLSGKNPLCDYLLQHSIDEVGDLAGAHPWSRVIWDVTAVAWLLNEKDRFFSSELRHSPIPEYDGHWAFDNRRHLMRYVTAVNRDALFEDLFRKISR